MDANERARKYRARKRGENVPRGKPGPKKGFKQSDEHIEKRKRFGPDHHLWIGGDIQVRSGRTRAGRAFKKEPCEICGESKKVIDRHHLDGATKNNERSNIQFLCRKCHMREDGRLEKFSELGKKMQPIALAARWS